jgi:hypothetical protein
LDVSPGKPKAVSSHRTPQSPPVTTNLGVVLKELQNERADTLAAVIMLTDAAHNDETSPDPWNAAADLADVPVHVIPIGGTEPLRDLVLYSVVAPPVVMAGDEIVIEANLRAIGCAGESPTLELSRNGEPIDTKQVELDSDATGRRVTFNTKLNEPGTMDFTIRVKGLDAEQSDANNEQRITVDVTRRNIRVFLADGLARWEFNYLRELFHRDDKVVCDTLTFAPRIVAKGAIESNPRLPATVDEWARYDVAIVGDIPAEHFSATAQQAFHDFVAQRGGAAVILAGDGHMPGAYAASPILELLPVQSQEPGPEPEDGYRLLLTSSGRRNPALAIGDEALDSSQMWEFVSRNVPIYTLSQYCLPKPTATTLIEAVDPSDSRRLDAAVDGGMLDTTSTKAVSSNRAPNKAFLCWHSFGRGRVIYLSSPDTWRLRFRSGDRLHHRFWGQLLRWAIARELRGGSELVQIRTSRSHYDAKQPIDVEVRLADPDGNPRVVTDLFVMAERSDGVSESLELAAVEEIPGRYLGRFAGLQAGEYTLQPAGKSIDEMRAAFHVASPSARVVVAADKDIEHLDTRCRLDIAQKIADASGGQVIPPTAIGEILALTDLRPIVRESTESRPIWPRWKYFWVVFLCLSTEWGMRKWKGLP